MPKGPQLNDISRNFTSRDSLGIEGVATTIQGEICPVVNTVTPRAFYWPFMVWIYYDFYKYSGIEEHTVTEFDKYLKRQDYFFVLATLLTPGSDQNNLVGKQQAQMDIDEDQIGPYPFNPKYFKTRYGGMQYYNAGCLSMYFITDRDPEKDKDLSFPALRPEGEKMAKAFEAVIKDTEYYKSYRRNDSAVPRSVLEEYGKVISFRLNGFDECKQLLRHYMFEDDRAVQLTSRSTLLTECADYVRFIINDKGIKELNGPICRQVFFDRQSPSEEMIVLPERLLPVSNKWEIVVGRMYFTSGIEMIWKYMLEQLVDAMSLNEWFHHAFVNADFSWNLNDRVLDHIDECNYDFKTREGMIAASARRDTSSYSMENGLKVILSIYNRFKERPDFGDEKSFLNYGIDTQSISFEELFKLIESYKARTVKDLLRYIMKKWLVEQHYITAFEKMLQGRDGFYYELIDDKYVRKYDFGMAFQGIRMIQLSQVMRDLDML